MRLLSIEDERSTAAYLQKGLTEHGHVVDTAFDGVEGLHLATSGHYDLILLDVGLPGASGWDVLQGIRTQQQTPVFFISGRDEVEDRVKGLLLGADDYMVKPFAFSELLARIQVVARRRAPMSAPEGVLRVGEGNDWLEILGSGMVNPKVLEYCGLDPKEWQGFAFGMGIDRIAMLKYGIPDLRAFFDADLRWLRHYGFSALDMPDLAGGLSS